MAGAAPAEVVEEALVPKGREDEAEFGVSLVEVCDGEAFGVGFLDVGDRELTRVVLAFGAFELGETVVESMVTRRLPRRLLLQHQGPPVR